jgi:hypothetical protein
LITPIAVTLLRMSRTTTWRQVGELPLRFDAHHPQGMVRVDGVWWLTTVDIAEHKGFVLAVGDRGALVQRTAVGDHVRFHPGGLDYDGEALWVASAEYRPRSSAMVERLVPATSVRPELRFTFDDHIGSITRLGPTGDLIGWSWGSRRFMRWTDDGELVATARHPGHFIDYQDGQWIGDERIVCGGVATVQGNDGPIALGGVGVLDAATLTMVKEVPFPMYAPSGRPATHNPLFAEVENGSLLVHLLPDDGRGSILTYATDVVES